MINVLFLAYNRKAYTEAAFDALVENTDWEQVASLHVHDDGSEDGTYQWLEQRCTELEGIEVNLTHKRLGSPVAAMNHHLDLYGDNPEVGAFVKIDNDFIVCPNWLGDVLYQMTLHPGIDIFGIQPRFGPPQDPPYQYRDVEDCRWIGGIGAIRYRVFQVCRPTPNGYFGWTEFQGKHEDVRKAWLTPDMPCFSLGLIGAEPWQSLAREYIAKGWMREWADYGDGGAGYHEWFTRS